MLAKLSGFGAAGSLEEAARVGDAVKAYLRAGTTWPAGEQVVGA